jgi:uncharacterized membrane protein YadS
MDKKLTLWMFVVTFLSVALLVTVFSLATLVVRAGCDCLYNDLQDMYVRFGGLVAGLGAVVRANQLEKSGLLPVTVFLRSTFQIVLFFIILVSLSLMVAINM